MAVKITLQVVVFPFPSVAVITTVVVWLCARVIWLPEAGFCVKVTVPQLSVPVSPEIRSGTVILQFVFNGRV